MTVKGAPSGAGCRIRYLLLPLFVLLPLLGAIPGILAGRWFYLAQAQGKLEKWKRLPDPPQPAREILAADTNRLYVSTSGGIYYCANVNGCLTDLVSCWEVVELVDESRLSTTQVSDHFYSTYRVPDPPVVPAQLVAVSLRRAETYDETYYVRSREGEIWIWHWGNLSFFTIGLVLLVYCGSVCWCSGVGFAVAWVVFAKVK